MNIQGQVLKPVQIVGNGESKRTKENVKANRGGIGPGHLKSQQSHCRTTDQ